MSKIIKSNLAKAMDYKKIDTIKLPQLKEVLEGKEEEILEPSPEELIEITQKERQRILDAAKKEAENLKGKAIKEGYEEGYKDGLSQGKKQIKELESKFLSQFNQLLEGFHKAQEILLNNAEQEVLEIVLFITQKLVGDLIKEKDDLVVELYKILKPLVTDKKVKEIIINTLDAQAIKDYLNFIHKSDQVKVTLSPEINKGSIKVVTEQGYILYDLKQQMEEIIGELRKVNE